ncbi:EamA family transporter RarD [Pseudorhodobacter sp. MZDSW-24AT]|uniref:EamA family transporter RarD n=1 Tax=Pseudorhodobacter sp. MZDSW-24AT TaxID=2052957 RepID=UPI000C1F147B|nr:EamA family transporter RarD [Pseudorhodobacter sp. MZDSW-24AT]PJF10689.1 EamA family transporter RarD [Pseudorhodobacter sp. MZDSW-24AT]
MTDALPPKNEDSRSGFLFALAAYLMWGFLPLYMKALAHVSPFEVIAHRVLWSLPIGFGVILILGRTQELRIALRTPRTLMMAAATAALISVNWGTYVWAIGAGHALEAALGYYINPLFSVFLGRVILKEHLSPAQWVALALAAAAVVLLTVDAGQVPVVALGLTVSWGIYAYLKKSLPIGPNQGFTLEVMLLAPFAAAYLIWLHAQGAPHFAQGVTTDTLLLIGTGVITAVPLMIYANGAKRLRLSTIAMMQYISPTIIFVIAVFIFDEPFGTVRLIAFPMIWAALVIYTVASFRARGRARQSSSVIQTGT